MPDIKHPIPVEKDSVIRGKKPIRRSKVSMENLSMQVVLIRLSDLRGSKSNRSSLMFKTLQMVQAKSFSIISPLDHSQAPIPPKISKQDTSRITVSLTHVYLLMQPISLISRITLKMSISILTYSTREQD